jgi:hypothetical protein
VSDSKKASAEEQAARLAICHGCVFFNAERRRCMKCGCNIRAKISSGKTVCPLNKWGKSNG